MTPVEAEDFASHFASYLRSIPFPAAKIPAVRGALQRFMSVYEYDASFDEQKRRERMLVAP